MKTRALILDDISHAMEIAASTTDVKAIYAAIDELAQRTIGHRLFTVVRYLEATAEVERLYSSNPSEYPPSGRKRTQGTPWGEAVLDRGEVFIAANAEGVRASYIDHVLLSRLGIGAVMNVPIRFRRRVLGTMNLSHVAGHYSARTIEPGQVMAGLLVPLLLDGILA